MVKSGLGSGTYRGEGQSVPHFHPVAVARRSTAVKCRTMIDEQRVFGLE